MTPPALNSVGDKLHDAALAESISRQGPPHRPYLLVQMPKFNLTKEQLASLTAYFTATDRIPRGAGVPPAVANTAGETPAPRLLAAGPRLVTTDGLACTSCHQVGSVLPAKAPLNARGPNLSMLEKRIRREWFDRWCDNPARIVPRMEMPVGESPRPRRPQRKNRRPARRRLAHPQHARLRAPRAQPRPRPAPLRRPREERTAHRHPRRVQRRRQDLSLSRSSSACPTATTSSSTSKPTASPPGGSATRPGSGRRGRAGIGRWGGSRSSMPRIQRSRTII